MLEISPLLWLKVQNINVMRSDLKIIIQQMLKNTVNVPLKLCLLNDFDRADDTVWRLYSMNGSV